MRAPLCLVGAVLMLGCATPVVYGPISAENGGFGYADARNADGSHTIRVVAPNAGQAHAFWDQRAAEICGSTSYRKNIFRAEIPVVSYSGYVTGANGYGGAYTEDRYGAPILEGYLRCESNVDDSAPSAEDESAP